MQRAGELHIQCGWHLLVALSLRDRRLSARNPGPASPVETFHPRVYIIPILYIFTLIIKILHVILEVTLILCWGLFKQQKMQRFRGHL